MLFQFPKNRTVQQKSLFVILLLTLILFIETGFCQNEASVWLIGNGKQINFQSGNIEPTAFPGNGNAKYTICDKNGNLLLYTDGISVWNKNHEILVNGDNLHDRNYHPLYKNYFVPYPGKEGFYLLIYESVYYLPGDLYNIRNKKIVYAEIDINAQFGRGEVISKNIKIHENYHTDPTIAGYCNNSYFWLLVDTNEHPENIHRDRICFYKIDENGVNLTPKINDSYDIGNSGGYRFSPNGDKFYSLIDVNGASELLQIIADFDFVKGEVYNWRSFNLKVNYNKEFSPNSQFLYFFSDAKLIQIDVSFSSAIRIRNSIDTILSLDKSNDVLFPGEDIQIGPDGKVYFYYFDVHVNQKKLGRINSPNRKGDACNVELDVATINSNYPFLPDFVTSFFRDQTPEYLDEIFPDAGSDFELCANSSHTIGAENSPEAFYTWIPDADVENPFSPETIFEPDLQLYDFTKNAPFVLRATDGNCWVNFDEINVNLLPVPKEQPIDGSWSVCPFVERVEYQTNSEHFWDKTEGTTLNWFVIGGEIDTFLTPTKVEIDWWETNSNASVNVFAINDYTCISDTSIFPVRINVELITETPKGPNKICLAKAKNQVYEIRNTNGSVYDWFPENGDVIYGQGTNRVGVNWLKEGIQKITVEETSLTIDTICFGESEPLFVEIVNDSLEISLSNVSFNAENNIEVFYQSNKLNRDKHSLFLINENEIVVHGLYNGSFIFESESNWLKPEIFQLKAVNSCNEIFYSNLQETIVLKGQEVALENTISLSWNTNRFWENNKLIHEIWYSENGVDNWKRLETLDSETVFSYNFQSISLFHYFRIKEINVDKNIESWSNTLKIEIDDTLEIPDVITPNNDGFNDVWEIKYIDFHSFKRVLVFNKLGQIVYECKNQFQPWNGKINGEIIQGTYFYQITFDSESTRYGQISILK